jgi:SH3-like domain-containing protein
MPYARLSCFLVILLGLGCGSPRERRAPPSERFVGPPALKIYEDLGPQQPAVATVHHGDRLEVVGRRRAFVRVRTPEGIEGWTDGRQLFSHEQVEELHWLADQAARLAPQGTATVYAALNVRTHPNRNAPAFYQIQEGDRVEVVAHRLEPRVPFRPDEAAPEVPPDTPVDDWALVRTPDGRAGWTLFHMLTLAVPDEVAQYAEGHRITSYFSLGEVKSRDQVKHNWLWTTISSGRQPFQFDGFRVFVWSTRRHRYETAYRERNLRGYYPVEVHPAPEGGATSPSFSLVVEEKDGVRYRRTYAFEGYRVRLVGKSPWDGPSLDELVRKPPEAEPEEQDERSFFTRLGETLTQIKNRWIN